MKMLPSMANLLNFGASGRSVNFGQPSIDKSSSRGNITSSPGVPSRVPNTLKRSFLSAGNAERRHIVSAPPNDSSANDPFGNGCVINCPFGSALRL